MPGGDRHNADFALIGALASGQPITDAARIAGVSAATAHRRLREPNFRHQVADARAVLLAQAVGVLAAATTEAARTLQALLQADSDSVRARAAVAILDQTRAGIELGELSERVAALEEQATATEQLQGTKPWSA